MTVFLAPPLYLKLKRVYFIILIPHHGSKRKQNMSYSQPFLFWCEIKADAPHYCSGAASLSDIKNGLHSFSGSEPGAEIVTTNLYTPDFAVTSWLNIICESFPASSLLCSVSCTKTNIWDVCSIGVLATHRLLINVVLWNPSPASLYDLNEYNNLLCHASLIPTLARRPPLTDIGVFRIKCLLCPFFITPALL